jgi:hypothetical protein
MFRLRIKLARKHPWQVENIHKCEILLNCGRFDGTATFGSRETGQENSAGLHLHQTRSEDSIQDSIFLVTYNIITVFARSRKRAQTYKKQIL